MKSKAFIQRNSATVLAIAGAVGVVATVITTTRAAPKALRLLKEAEELEKHELTIWQKMQVVIPVYIPVILTGSATIFCILSSNILNKVSQASLTSAYMMIDQSYKNYQRKEVDKKVQNVSDQISEFEIIIADKVSTDQLEAAVGRITKLETDNVTVNKKLTVNEADISDLKAKNAEITERLTVNEADIDDLNAKKLDVEVADIKYATIENLEATDATIRNLKSDYADFKDTTRRRWSVL